MEKETKLQILEAAMDLAYQRLAALKAEDMEGESAKRLLENLSGLMYTHERVKYPYERDPFEDGATTPAPECDAPEQSTPTPESYPPADIDKGEVAPTAPKAETAAETPAPATLSLVEVRTILSGVADKVDLPSLLQKFGADKLSTVDPANYAALVQAAKEAAGEA